MSASALIFERTGRDEVVRPLAPMLAAMGHRGPDGRNVRDWPHLALGHLHFWTTPEEVGERQPLVGPGGQAIAFDGRLDNREEIWRSLPRSPGALQSMSDAALALAAYQARGDAAFARFLGPFALVLVAPTIREVVLVRDVLGGRTLSYSLDRDRLVVASEAHAVVGHPRVPHQLDSGRVATYFSAGELHDAATFFTGVQELPAGHLLRITPKSQAQRRFDALTAPVDEQGLDGWTARFSEVFDASVSCRLRAIQSPGVMLSGGLDSAPIAASAALALSGQRLPTFSWVFDHHPASDERSFLKDLEHRYNLDATHIPCDDAGPFGALDAWPTHPATPEQNPYRRFHQRVYRAARDSGASVVLSGMCGDQLYAGTEHWLSDLAANGGWRALGTELWRLARGGELVRRTTLRGLVPARWAAWRRRGLVPPWLTARAANLLPRAGEVPPPGWVQRPRQYELLAGGMNGHGFGVEAFHAHGCGVEVRHPLRDRRLIQLMLGIPTSALVAGGVQRPVVRQAFRDRLPASIIERRDKATFEPILRAALFGGQEAWIRELLEAPDAHWHRYVRRDWLRPHALNVESDGTRLLVLWMCLGFELWRTRCRPT